MWPEIVVLPAPSVGQALGLSHRGKQFSVEELIPEPAVERLCKAVLPWGSWLDVGGLGTAVFAPKRRPSKWCNSGGSAPA